MRKIFPECFLSCAAIPILSSSTAEVCESHEIMNIMGTRINHKEAYRKESTYDGEMFVLRSGMNYLFVRMSS